METAAKTTPHQGGEVDSSVPFESVKDAVTRFGGLGFWKPIFNTYAGVISSSGSDSRQCICVEEVDSGKLEEQAAVWKKELIVKERETLDVLKELESTKRLVEELKLKLQKEESEASVDPKKRFCDLRSAEKEKDEEQNKASTMNDRKQSCNRGFIPYPSSSPALILMQLQQAKLNLSRTNHDLAEVRASSNLLNKKLEKERISLEKTRERLSQNTLKISSLEEELTQMRLRLQAAKCTETKCASGDPSGMTRELHQLSSEAEHFKKMGEAAKSEVLRTMSEIEKTKSMIKTAEMKLVAARKMKEAAKAAEAAALAEIDVLSNHEGSQGNCVKNHDGVTLSIKEYNALICKAEDAEEQSKKRVTSAMLKVDEANLCKLDILIRAQEATEEVKTSKKALEEALERVELANREKIAVEEALRMWRSEGFRRRSSIHFSTKFKASYPSHRRRDSLLLDVNGMSLVNDEAKPVLRPTLSIGQILSKKLFLPLEFEPGMLGEPSSVKRKVSLGQILGKQHSDPSSDDQVEKENSKRKHSLKRKNFGFTRISILLSKQQKKTKKNNKKKPTSNFNRLLDQVAVGSSSSDK